MIRESIVNKAFIPSRTVGIYDPKSTSSTSNWNQVCNAGLVCSAIVLYDKENDREVIEDGETANRLTVYEDYPREYDAWEITDYYKQKYWTIDDVSEVEMIRDGLRIIRKYQKSKVVQDIVLKPGARRVDFNTTIDWQEDHVLLKTLFPVAVRNTDAVYDIQFGNLRRPTHANTSWDVPIGTGHL